MKSLEQLWQEQIAYNEKVRAKEHPTNFEYWMKQYVLGAVSEVDEILQEINWKLHRRGHPVNKHNLARELADLTKYVFCMWEWSGFGWQDLLDFVEEKNRELAEQYAQEFQFEIPEGSPVIITDIDGTLGNYRRAFYEWLTKYHGEILPEDPSKHLAMDIDLGMSYGSYVAYKEEFESSGGYGFLQPYYDAEDAIKNLWARGAIVIAFTARPGNRYSRIWSDTWRWFEKHGLHIPISALYIGSEERITKALELLEKGHKVILLEDDPGIALRAANSGITVGLRSQPYNAGLQHDNIWKFERYDPRILKDFLDLEWRTEC